MTGTGTITDPYLVADIYDFIGINDSTTYSGDYFKLTANIDFNSHETYKFGLTKQFINRPTAYLNCDGHSIRNVIIKEISSSSNAPFIFQKYLTVILKILY